MPEGRCVSPEIPWPDTKFIPEFTRLKAIVGGGKLSADHWPEWSRIQSKYGWPLLLKAADRCEPLERWPSAVEHLCAQLKKSESEQFQPVEPKPVTSAAERKAKAAQFAAILKTHGLAPEERGK